MTENNTSWLLALPSLVFIFTSESAFLFHTKKHMFAVQQICQPQFCQWYSGIKGLFSMGITSTLLSQSRWCFCLRQSHTHKSLWEKRWSIWGSSWESPGTMSFCFLILTCLTRRSQRHTFNLFEGPFVWLNIQRTTFWPFWHITKRLQ